MASKQHSLGAVIQGLRQQAGLTQDELSDKAGLAYSTLAKIERGAIKNPSVFTVYEIARSLDISVEELMGAKALTISTAKSSSVKMVFVDMNGVLVHFFQRAFVTLSEQTGIPFNQIETAYWYFDDDVGSGRMSMDDFEEAFSDQLGIKKISWKQYYIESVEPIREMQSYLKSLEGKVKLGLLTNTMPGLIDALRERQLIPKIKFDVVIDSSEVKALKPEPAIYEIAEKMSGFRGSDILFVDDTQYNLMAAERLGWRVEWFDDYNPEESIERIDAAIFN